jgi:adenylate cyclase
MPGLTVTRILRQGGIQGASRFLGHRKFCANHVVLPSNPYAWKFGKPFAQISTRQKRHRGRRRGAAPVPLPGVVLRRLLLARTFTRPLKALTNSANAIESGDFDHAKVQVSTRDELGRFALTFNSMVDGIKARQRERDIFGRMVSPEVREKLLAGELKLGGENLRVSVLFSDIRGFSTMSEKMSPHDVVMLLNDYLTEMTEAVRPWGGYVNNFIGDAIVVVFGAPETRDQCEARAIRAALAMRSRLEDLNRRRMELGDPPIRTGIGISTGKVVAGQIGSIERFMYTVIGDAVNVAARLEELTKQFSDNPILVNAATHEGCIRSASGIRLLDKGLQKVKGREEPVHVYAVDATMAMDDANPAPAIETLAS